MLTEAFLSPYLPMLLRYKDTKRGLFNIHTDEYSASAGWVQKQESRLIIGETADTYITEFKETEIPYWDEYGKYSAFSTIALGIHKSRFIKWQAYQMNIKFKL